MAKYKVYGGKSCKWCHKALNLLEDFDLNFEYIDIDANFASRTEFFSKFADISNNKQTIPLIFVDDTYLGGYKQLEEYVSKHEDAYDDDF